MGPLLLCAAAAVSGGGAGKSSRIIIERKRCVRVISTVASPPAVSELARIGFPPPVSVQVSGRVSSHTERAHKRACYTAHVAAHAWAVSQNCSLTLVVEEDAVFSADASHKYGTAEAIWSAASRPGIETLWLGYHASAVAPPGTSRESLPATVRLEKPMLAHAIVFSAAASARVASLPRWRRRGLSIYEAFDVALWHDAGLTAHGVYPPVAGQRWSGKSVYLDWSKSLSGMAVVNWFSYDRCSALLARSSYVARFVGLFMALPDDAYSLASAYRCP